jgi:hypothetical protein
MRPVMPKNPHAQALVGLNRLTREESMAEMARLRQKYTEEEIAVLTKKRWVTIHGWATGRRRAPKLLKELT